MNVSLMFVTGILITISLRLGYSNIESGNEPITQCNNKPVFTHTKTHICIMVITLAWNTVDRGFKLRSGQTKDYKIGMCCLFA